jgi:hypothetical protein
MGMHRARPSIYICFHAPIHRAGHGSLKSAWSLALLMQIVQFESADLGSVRPSPGRPAISDQLHSLLGNLRGTRNSASYLVPKTFAAGAGFRWHRQMGATALIPSEGDSMYLLHG